jgi:predicted nucleic-acid-binding protein
LGAADRLPLDRATIAAALGRLADSAGVTLEDERAARLALAAFAAGPADLSDYVILEVARARNALPLRTFDERLALAEGAAAGK